MLNVGCRHARGFVPQVYLPASSAWNAGDALASISVQPCNGLGAQLKTKRALRSLRVILHREVVR